MKIILHTDEYYPTGKACAYRMQVFADVFMSEGHQVTVITSSANKPKNSNISRTERIIYAPAIPMKKKTTMFRLLNNLSFAITSVFASLKAGKADVVITTSPPVFISPSGRLIAKIKRAKLIYDVRDIWPDVAVEMESFSEDSAYAKVFRVLTDSMYRSADLITTVSPGKVAKIQGKLNGVIDDKVMSVENGFDETIIREKIDSDLVRRYSLDKKKTCVYIGNIGLAQGLGTLLDLAKEPENAEYQFLIFGDGAERKSLENRVKDERINNVIIAGELPHSQVVTILSYAAVSYIPLKSASMKDSIPTKLYEALGLGCPVLLVAEGDACRIAEESGLGVCVSPNYPEDISKAFAKLVSCSEDFSLLKKQTMELVMEKYSRQKAAEQLSNRLNQMILS